MKMISKHILITGGAGYIGSKFAAQLAHDGHQVCVVDDLSTGLRVNIDAPVKFYKADINSSDFQDIVSKEKPECLVHMAASKSVNESMINPRKFIHINVEGSKRVIDAAIANKVKTFVFTSTAGVYGEVHAHKAQTESDSPNPSSIYAETKLEIERYLQAKERRGLKGYIVRFANVYGWGGKAEEKGAVNIFIEKILAGEKILIHGDGTQTRDFVHIDDLLAMCSLLTLNPPSIHNDTPIFNVSTGKDISINALVDLIGKLSGKQVHTAFLPNTFIGQKSSLLSTEKAKKMLGWSSRISLHDGIADMIATYKKSL